MRERARTCLAADVPMVVSDAAPPLRPHLARVLREQGCLPFTGSHVLPLLPVARAWGLRQMATFVCNYAHGTASPVCPSCTMVILVANCWSGQAASSIKAAKGEGRVWARGTPPNQETKRTTLSATAMRTCCRWVLAWPM